MRQVQHNRRIGHHRRIDTGGNHLGVIGGRNRLGNAGQIRGNIGGDIACTGACRSARERDAADKIISGKSGQETGKKFAVHRSVKGAVAVEIENVAVSRHKGLNGTGIPRRSAVSQVVNKRAVSLPRHVAEKQVDIGRNVDRPVAVDIESHTVGRNFDRGRKELEIRGQVRGAETDIGRVILRRIQAGADGKVKRRKEFRRFVAAPELVLVVPGHQQIAVGRLVPVVIFGIGIDRPVPLPRQIGLVAGSGIRGIEREQF